jgi:hypothetical protein
MAITDMPAFNQLGSLQSSTSTSSGPLTLAASSRPLTLAASSRPPQSSTSTSTGALTLAASSHLPPPSSNAASTMLADLHRRVQPNPDFDLLD